MRFTRWIVLIAIALVGFAGNAFAGEWSDWVEFVEPTESPEPLVKYRAKLDGDTLTVEASHKEHFHTYAFDNDKREGISAPTKITVEGVLEIAGPWTSPEPKPLGSETGGVPYDFAFEGTVQFTAKIKRKGEGKATLSIFGQVCEEYCYYFNEKPLQLEIDVKESASQSSPVMVEDFNAVTTEWTGWVGAPEGDDFVSYRARLHMGKLEITASHAPEYHTYAFDNTDRGGVNTNTSITVSGALEVTGTWSSPDEIEIDNYGSIEYGYGNEATFSAPVKRGKGESASIIIEGQVCLEQCFLVSATLNLSVPAPVLVAATNGDSETSESTSTSTDTEESPSAKKQATKKSAETRANSESQTYELVEFTTAKGKKKWVLPKWGTSLEAQKDDSWLGFVLLCIGGAMIALIMPCVYPMIPITVSFFSKQAEQREGSTASVALVYGFGVVFSYTALGFLLTAIGGATGVTDFSNSVIVAILIAVFFLVFAMSMFGAFELQLPPSLMQKFNLHGKASGYGGAFLLGSTFAVTSMACTVPVVALILAYAVQGEILRPLFGMLIYSSVVAAPFVILGMLPGLLKRLPKAGGWMNSVKIVFGFIELAAAAEFFGWARLISREWVIAIWIACFFFAALYLVKLVRGKYDPPNAPASPWGMAFASLFLAVALWLTTGLFGGSLGFIESFLRHPVNEDWIQSPDLREIVAEAKDKRQSIFIDVTADN